MLSLAAIGVPVGYFLHQIYFGVAWVLNANRNFDNIVSQIGKKFLKHDTWGNNKNEDYYQLEYVWHMVLIKQHEDTRKYLEGRYRHLLSTIHRLGSLLISSSISLLMTIIIWCTFPEKAPNSLYLWIGIITQILVFLSALFYYAYFSSNLKSFQIKILKTYL